MKAKPPYTGLFNPRFRGLHLRLALVRDGPADPNPSPLTSPQAAYEYLRDLADEPHECFAVLLLTARNTPIGVCIPHVGTIDAALVRPRDVFKAALVANAPRIIVAHNHPSGDPTPSPEDRAITNTLAAAGRLLDVDVLDHLIIVRHGHYFSFKENGLLERT